VRVAVIDLGSNSIRFLAADTAGGSILPIYRDLITTRLGKSVAAEGLLDPNASDATIAAVRTFLHKAQSLGCEEIRAFGTSALREAANRDEFLRKLKEGTGLPADILSGHREAELSYIGARMGLGLSGPVCVADIGGGSAEISFGDERNFTFESIPLGAVRWTEYYLLGDPPKGGKIARAARKARKLLAPVAEGINAGGIEEPFAAVGVGGTWTTLAAVSKGLTEYDSKKIHGTVLRTDDVKRIHDMIVSSTIEQRCKIPGIPKARADIIAAGCIIALSIMEVFGFTCIQISEADLQEGYILKNLLT